MNKRTLWGSLWLPSQETLKVCHALLQDLKFFQRIRPMACTFHPVAETVTLSVMFKSRRGDEGNGAGSESAAVAHAGQGLASEWSSVDDMGTRARHLTRRAEILEAAITAETSVSVREKSNDPLTLIPVQPATPALLASPIEIILDTRPGLRLSLLPGFDTASLARLLDILEARC